MSPHQTQALELGLDHLPPGRREKVLLFRLVIGLAGRLRGRLDQRLAADGVTTQQATLLTLARAAPTPPTQGELARALGVSHQNVRQLATALERKGLLRVVTDEADRRVRRLVPTAAVSRVFARRDDDDFAAIEGWLSALSRAETTTALRLLRRLARGLPLPR